MKAAYFKNQRKRKKNKRPFRKDLRDKTEKQDLTVSGGCGLCFWKKQSASVIREGQQVIVMGSFSCFFLSVVRTVLAQTKITS